MLIQASLKVRPHMHHSGSACICCSFDETTSVGQLKAQARAINFNQLFLGLSALKCLGSNVSVKAEG